MLQRSTWPTGSTSSRRRDIDVDGFADDTLVRRALELLAPRAGVRPAWHARIEKHIPVAAGLGGGSSDAATALALANATLDEPLPRERLHELARRLGADVPFFLTERPAARHGDGTDLKPLDLPQDYWIVLVLPHGAAKLVDRRRLRGVRPRRRVRRTARRALLPLLDRASAVRARPRRAARRTTSRRSPLADELRAAGAFRADVSGAGPAVYGLFLDEQEAVAAAAELRPTRPGLDHGTSVVRLNAMSDGHRDRARRARTAAAGFASTGFARRSGSPFSRSILAALTATRLEVRRSSRSA